MSSIPMWGFVGSVVSFILSLVATHFEGLYEEAMGLTVPFGGTIDGRFVWVTLVALLGVYASVQVSKESYTKGAICFILASVGGILAYWPGWIIGSPLFLLLGVIQLVRLRKGLDENAPWYG